MAPRLITQGSAWVQPAAPIKSKTIIMSSVDNQCAQVYVAGQWFIADNERMLDPQIHFKYLKRGLARVLCEQPILAGTLRQDERGAYSVEIPPAPHAGVEFHYLDLSNDYTFPTFEQLRRKNFPHTGGGQDGLEKLYPNPFPGSSAGDPVTTTQLTRIRGGLCIFMAVTHLIGDLIQPRFAIVGWSRESALVSRAAQVGESEPPLPSPFPEEMLDRSRLIIKADRVLDYAEVKKIAAARPEIAILDPTDPVGSAEAIQNTFPPALLLPSEAPLEDNLRTITTGTWRFPLRSLKKLQELAQRATRTKLSIVDVVKAFLWQRFYMAKYAVNADFSNETRAQRPARSAIVYPADVRGRLNPPLHPLYMGAAVDIFRAEAKYEEMIPENDTDTAFAQSLTNVAAIIRASHSKWSEERFWTFMRMSSQTPENLPLFPAGPIDFFITDQTRNADMNTLDFGYGLETNLQQRQPYAGRDFPPGEVTLLPRVANGDFEVMMCAERVILQRLLRDEIMNKFGRNLFMAHNLLEANQQEQPLASMSRL